MQIGFSLTLTYWNKALIIHLCMSNVDKVLTLNVFEITKFSAFMRITFNVKNLF